MDVDSEKREKRWSMNSQRLEEIVAELMKPISDIRRNFDTDLSALLEEYLTEAGLRALEQGEGDGGEEVAPNFAEIALLLQQSAHIYSRKVDCLYQDVLRVTDALNNSTLEENVGGGEAEVNGAGGSAKRRVAAAAAAGDFEPIRLERSTAARREAPLRPPPTLPRLYIELEPRPLAPTDTQLIDYAAEPIGLLADFHVFWTLKHGLLLEELEESGGSDGERPPLTAPPPPPSPPPPLTLPQLSVPSPPPSPLLPPSPFNCSTPLPRPLKRERKRRIATTADVDPAAKMLISEEVLRALRDEHAIFGISPQWIRRVVEKTRRQVLQCTRAPSPPFRGWDAASVDIGGFCGWPEEAARSALDTALGEAQRLRLRSVEESDDDGFFEQSSSSDGEPRRSPEPPLSDWQRWRDGVLARTSDSAPDIRHTAALLLRSTPAAPAPPLPFTALLRHHHAAHHTRPAHLMLAALFLANSGNIEIVEGEPLSINSFSVRLLSSDEALYQPAMARDPLS